MHPAKLYTRTLSDLHEGHKGTEKVQLLTWAMVYWSGINANIADYVRRSNLCTRQKATWPVQSMLTWNIPECPWQDISADHFTNKGKDNFLICNTYSKYPFIYKASSKTAQSLTQKLQDLILQYRPPSIYSLTTGPPSPEDLTRFMQKQQITTSHHHLSILDSIALLRGKWRPSRLPSTSHRQ